MTTGFHGIRDACDAAKLLIAATSRALIACELSDAPQGDFQRAGTRRTPRGGRTARNATLGMAEDNSEDRLRRDLRCKGARESGEGL
jgi:hypothetical protein